MDCRKSHTLHPGSLLCPGSWTGGRVGPPSAASSPLHSGPSAPSVKRPTRSRAGTVLRTKIQAPNADAGRLTLCAPRPLLRYEDDAGKKVPGQKEARRSATRRASSEPSTDLRQRAGPRCSTHPGPAPAAAASGAPSRSVGGADGGRGRGRPYGCLRPCPPSAPSPDGKRGTGRAEAHARTQHPRTDRTTDSPPSGRGRSQPQPSFPPAVTR